MKKIFLSLLGTPEDQLLPKMKKYEPLCDGFHIDVMDGKFVKNRSFEGKIFDVISKQATKQLFIHFMVTNPRNSIEPLHLKAHDMVSFHLEATYEALALIGLLREKQLLPGLAISPSTPIEKVLPYIDLVDFILIMSVEPGAGGQPFIRSSTNKVEALDRYRKENNLRFKIAIDGGINQTNIPELCDLGVDIFTVGSGVFKAENPEETIKNLYLLFKEK
jgi:ribulose-phosphate 3-epimerase